MLGRGMSIKFFTTAPLERRERDPVELHTHSGQTYRCTFGFDRNALYYTHLQFVESTLTLFPPSPSLTEHARWESLIKRNQGSHLSIPYDLPAQVKVTYRLSCLQFTLLMQAWPLQFDELFKVLNDYHLSVCFSCRTGNLPLLHSKGSYSGFSGLGVVLTSSVHSGRHELICHI